MATWFIRLGRNSEPDNQALYQGFANEHSLVKIGYGIKEDITDKKTPKEIEDYIVTTKGKRSLEIRARLVHKFINEIEIGDTIICPFGGSANRMRVGKVVSECKAIKTFFQGREKELNNFIAKHPNARDPQYIEFKPAREVEWQDKAVDLNDLPKYLQRGLAKTMRATVNRLNDLPDDIGQEKVKLNEVIRETAITEDYMSEVGRGAGFVINLLGFSKWAVDLIIPAAVSSVVSFALGAYFTEDARFSYGMILVLCLLGGAAGFIARGKWSQ